MSLTADTAVPVQPRERIQALDILRGFALLGIFIMNMPGFSTSFFAGAGGEHLWTAWWDRTAETTRDILFSGKFNSLFSFLFGIGFTIQLGRLMDRLEGKAVWVYSRRLLILFAFGFAHSCLFWNGDVLHIYAILGVLLLLIRKASDKVILAIICACLLYPTAMSTYRVTHFDKAEMARRVAEAKQLERVDNAIYGHGTFLQSVKRHTEDMQWIYAHFANVRGFYIQMFTTLLLGFIVGRRRIIQNARENLPLIRKVQWWCLGLGLACGLTFGIGGLFLKPMQISPLVILVSTTYAYCRPLLMLFYATTLVRLSLNETWARRLQPIALVGRMPLTNYLGQTLMGTFIFYGWGLGFWGKAGPALELLLAVVLYAAIQIPFSAFWLKRFQFGPMEYLWRTLTYGKPPAMRAPEPAAISTSAATA